MNRLSKYVEMLQKDLREIMSIRCGLDELNNFIMLIGFIFITIALFSHHWIFTVIGALLVVLCYVRVFSKNLEKRQKENAFYMKYMGNVVKVVRRYKLSVKMWYKSLKDAEYLYFVCSGCGQVIRIPKGKNKVSVRCPKCSKTFVKKS